jgi:predicted HicB family RNase H-like nuclease
MGQNIEILDESVFAPPPEAEEEDKPGATIFVRLPASLKARVEEGAKKGEMSVNALVVQTLVLRVVDSAANL